MDRSIIVTSVFAMTLFTAAASAATDSMALEQDKVKHFGVSLAAGRVSDTLVRNIFTRATPAQRLFLSVASGTLPGLAKEVLDSRQPNNRFSVADMTYNVLGVLTGTAANALFKDHPSLSLEMQINLNFQQDDQMTFILHKRY